MQRTLELSFDHLVIGSDLSAFAYCAVHNCPAIYMRVLAPYEYDENGTYLSDKRLWDDMAHILTYNNLLPFSDKIVSIRLEENALKAVTGFGVVITLKYNQLIISDDYKLEGLPPASGKTSEENWVIDWFHVKHAMIHPYEEITDYENNFVKKIKFYISKRFYKNALKKDCVSLSKIKDAELASGEYDENISRLKTLKMFKTADIKGVWDKTNECFIKPKLTSVKRDVYSLGKNTYANLPNNISMLYESADNIIKSPRKIDWKKYGINR